jgi:hypothetical protein
VAKKDTEANEELKAVVKTAEEWAKEKRVARFDKAITWAKHRWPVGKELTEEAFDAAIKAAKAEVIR